MGLLYCIWISYLNYESTLHFWQFKFSLYLRVLYVALYFSCNNNLKYPNIDLPKKEPKYSIKIPFWALNQPKYNQCVTQFPKNNTSLEFYLQKFIEVQNENKEYMPIYTDNGSKQNGKNGGNLKKHRNKTPSSVYKTSELINRTKEENKFVIYIYSLSILQTLQQQEPQITKIKKKLSGNKYRQKTN